VRRSEVVRNLFICFTAPAGAIGIDRVILVRRACENRARIPCDSLDAFRKICASPPCTCECDRASDLSRNSIRRMKALPSCELFVAVSIRSRSRAGKMPSGKSRSSRRSSKVVASGRKRSRRHHRLIPCGMSVRGQSRGPGTRVSATSLGPPFASIFRECNGASCAEHLARARGKLSRAPEVRVQMTRAPRKPGLCEIADCSKPNLSASLRRDVRTNPRCTLF